MNAFGLGFAVLCTGLGFATAAWATETTSGFAAATSPASAGGMAESGTSAGGDATASSSSVMVFGSSRDGHFVGKGRTVTSTTVDGHTTTHVREWSFPGPDDRTHPQ